MPYHQDAWELPAIVSHMGLSIVGQTVPSRVGGSIADCGGELTGPVATNNL